MQRRTLLGWAAAACGCPLAARSAGQPAFQDVLDTPALPSAQASKGQVSGLAKAGRRLVAVGQRGHVLTSDDAGRSWSQARVPVSSDLTAVHFPTPELGWAVGHDGVVLHSADAGRTWTRQLDGRSLGPRLVAAYARMGDPRWSDEARRRAGQGADHPLLDVWFSDARIGHVVGAFGLMLRTEDGGQSWEPLMHAADNPKALHLYAVRGAGPTLFVVGEQGLLLKWGSSRFDALASPYAGTLFGLVANERAVVAHGLRGHVVRSTDGGRQWADMTVGLGVGLTAGTLDGRGRMVLVSQAGHVLVSDNDGASFAARKLERPLPAAAVVALGDGGLVIGGPRGLQTLALP